MADSAPRTPRYRDGARRTATILPASAGRSTDTGSRNGTRRRRRSGPTCTTRWALEDRRLRFRIFHLNRRSAPAMYSRFKIQTRLSTVEAERILDQLVDSRNDRITTRPFVGRVENGAF